MTSARVVGTEYCGDPCKYPFQNNANEIENINDNNYHYNVTR